MADSPEMIFPLPPPLASSPNSQIRKSLHQQGGPSSPHIRALESSTASTNSVSQNAEAMEERGSSEQATDGSFLLASESLEQEGDSKVDQLPNGDSEEPDCHSQVEVEEEVGKSDRSGAGEQRVLEAAEYRIHRISENGEQKAHAQQEVGHHENNQAHQNINSTEEKQNSSAAEAKEPEMNGINTTPSKPLPPPIAAQSPSSAQRPLVSPMYSSLMSPRRDSLNSDIDSGNSIYFEAFNLLIKRNEAWIGVLDEMNGWLQEMHRHEKSSVAALKKLSTLVTIDNTKANERSVVNGMTSVVACATSLEAANRTALAKTLNVDTGVKVANLLQESQKRNRALRERRDQLWHDLFASRKRLDAISKQNQDISKFLKENQDKFPPPSDPWLLERQLNGEIEAEASLKGKIPLEVVKDLQTTKECELARGEIMKSTLLKYLNARKEMLEKLTQDVENAIQNVSEIDAENDWEYFAARFSVLDDCKTGLSRRNSNNANVPFIEKNTSENILLSGFLRRQGKLFGATNRYFVLTKHGYMHEFAAEESLNPEESFPLIPGRFEVSTVTAESFEFCFHNTQKATTFSTFFGGNDTKMVLIAGSKEEMLQWLTAIHDFSLLKIKK